MLGTARDASGEEIFLIPEAAPKPGKLELSWAPGPIAGSRFTPEEMARITQTAVPAGLREAVAKFAPAWQVANCGEEMEPGLRAEWGGRKQVLVTHPFDQQTPCVLSQVATIPAGKQTRLRVVVGHDPRGDFDLVIRADGRELLRKPVSKATAAEGVWLTEVVDLSQFAGRKVKLELLNQPSGWSWEAAYWGELALASE